jgi:hypothetical protein
VTGTAARLARLSREGLCALPLGVCESVDFRRRHRRDRQLYTIYVRGGRVERVTRDPMK